MIKFVPIIYPNETAYSYFCRFYAHSGYNCKRAFLNTVLNGHESTTEYDFVFPLSKDFRKELEKHIQFKHLLLEHSLFVHYARFLPKERRVRAFEYAMGNEPNLIKMLPVAHKKETIYLKYCPRCVEENRNKYGECYYHTVHQIKQITICPYHGCELINTDILNRNSRNSYLQPLEFVLGNRPIELSREISPDDINLRVAKYINEVIHQPFDLDLDISMSVYLKNRLDDKYLFPRAVKIDYDRLHKDILDYYKDLTNCDFKRWRLSYMFKHQMQTFSPFDIALVGMFEGITPEELCACSGMRPDRTAAFDEKVRELRKQKKTVDEICEILKVSKDVVKKILSGQYDGTKNEYVRFIARKRDNWDEVDEELCSRLDEYLATDPIEITLRSVGEYFGEDKTLLRLPKLRRKIAEYQKVNHLHGGRIKKKPPEV